MSLGEVRIQKDDAVNSLIAVLAKRDKLIDEEFCKLEEARERYGTNIQENLKITLEMEYILMSLRIIIANDTSRVKMALNQQSVSVTQQSLLKKRLEYLNLVDIRLNELREDFNSLQKLAYTMKNFTL